MFSLLRTYIRHHEWLVRTATAIGRAYRSHPGSLAAARGCTMALPAVGPRTCSRPCRASTGTPTRGSCTGRGPTACASAQRVDVGGSPGDPLDAAHQRGADRIVMRHGADKHEAQSAAELATAARYPDLRERRSKLRTRLRHACATAPAAYRAQCESPWPGRHGTDREPGVDALLRGDLRRGPPGNPPPISTLIPPSCGVQGVAGLPDPDRRCMTCRRAAWCAKRSVFAASVLAVLPAATRGAAWPRRRSRRTRARSRRSRWRQAGARPVHHPRRGSISGPPVSPPGNSRVETDLGAELTSVRGSGIVRPRQLRCAPTTT